MREHLGEEFGGTVSAATSFGLFVQLDGLYVEGLVHITELGGEYFRFDEARQELRGERTGTRYTVGSRVRVQVSRVDLDGRKIDFRMVNEGEEAALMARARRDKFGDKAGSDRSPGGDAVGELAVVTQADRALKAARKARAGAGKGAPPVRAVKAAARKGAAGRATKRR